MGILGLTGKKRCELLRPAMEQKYPGGNRSSWLYAAAALAILGAVFFFMARHRLVDVDEGYYLLAAKLVTEGKTPYIDFFYPQMPLLPYVYGWWMKLFGASWYSARCLSALLAIALGALVYFHLTKTTGKRSLGFLGAALFAFSSFSLAWFTVVKTYSLSALLVFLSYLFLRSSSASPKKYFWGGLFLGLAVDTRLLLAGLVLAAAAQILWLDKTPGIRASRLGWWAFGFLAALSLNGFFLTNPDNFFFNNLGYHLLRSDYGAAETLKLKLETGLKLFGIGATEPAFALQFLLLFLAALFFFRPFSNFAQKPLLGAIFAASLLIISFFPTPAYTQYFCVAVPFMIVVLLESLAGRWKEWFPPQGKKSRPVWRWGLSAALFLYLAGGIFDGYRYAFWGERVPGIDLSENAGNWKVEIIREISGLIDAYSTRTGEAVISWWPGYFVETEAVPLPGMENNFGLAIASRLTAEERRKYRIVSEEEIVREIRQRQVGLVVLDNRLAKLPDFHRRDRLLKEEGFALVQAVQSTLLYKRQGEF